MQTILQAAGVTPSDDAPLLAQLPNLMQHETRGVAHYPTKQPCIKLSFEYPFCDVADRVKVSQMLADAMIKTRSVKPEAVEKQTGADETEGVQHSEHRRDCSHQADAE